METYTMKPIQAITTLLLAVNFAYAQTSKPSPELAGAGYGEHNRYVLDIWFADTTKLDYS